jgi:hypothetical protein
VFCAVSLQKAHSFVFANNMITRIIYFHMLINWLMLHNDSPDFIFHQDGTPFEFHCEVQQYLNSTLSQWTWKTYYITPWWWRQKKSPKRQTSTSH